jgi:hypothetical protein
VERRGEIFMLPIFWVTVLFAQTETDFTLAPEQAEEKPKLLSEHPTILWMQQRSNAMRAKVNRSPLPLSEGLCEAACGQARFQAQANCVVTKKWIGNMVGNSYSTPYMNHFLNGTPESRARQNGYSQGVYEILAFTTPEFDVFQNWSSSAGHYARIVGPARCCGFGMAYGPDGVAHWCGLYGQ